MVILKAKQVRNHSESTRNEFLVEFSFYIGHLPRFSSKKTWTFLFFSKKIDLRGNRGNFDFQTQKISYLSIAKSSQADIFHKGSTYKYYLCVKFQLENSPHCEVWIFFVFSDRNSDPAPQVQYFWKIRKIHVFTLEIFSSRHTGGGKKMSTLPLPSPPLKMMQNGDDYIWTEKVHLQTRNLRNKCHI